MHVCNMGKYGGLLADALVLGKHVLTGLLPPVPVVQRHSPALGDDGVQLLVSEVAVVVLGPGGELVPVRVQAQDHAFAGDVASMETTFPNGSLGWWWGEKVVFP
jgi:hypothetical protein